MESQLDQTRLAHSAPSSGAEQDTRTSAISAPVTLLSIYGAVPALTVIALQFATNSFDPIEFFINSYGSGGGHRPAPK
jgi:hypothetical protein